MADLSASNFGSAGARPQRREWFLALADPERVYQGRFASGWRRKQCRLRLRTMPGAVVTLWRTGWCVGRQFVFVDGMGQTQLRFAGALSRGQSARKRLMNDAAQREHGASDDSLALAQTSVDLNWGGN